MKSKLLLHACCAVCGAHVAGELKEDFDVMVYFSNSNVWPEDEYKKRLEAARKLAEEYGIPIIEDAYDHSAWNKETEGLEGEPEGGKRCAVCFRARITRAAEYALKNNIGMIATTLPLSPFKNEKVINEIGEEIAVARNLEYLATDLLPGGKAAIWKATIKKTKELGLYRQKYCGCEWSVRTD